MDIQVKKVVFFRRTKQEIKEVYDSGFASMKKQIYSEQNGKCSLCLREVKEYGSDLDHRLPVVFGGDEIGIINLQILCTRCHVKKTAIEKQIIHVAKKLNILEKTGFETYTWYLDSSDEVLHFYEYVKTLVEKGNFIKENWWNIK